MRERRGSGEGDERVRARESSALKRCRHGKIRTRRSSLLRDGYTLQRCRHGKQSRDAVVLSQERAMRGCGHERAAHRGRFSDASTLRAPLRKPYGARCTGALLKCFSVKDTEALSLLREGGRRPLTSEMAMRRERKGVGQARGPGRRWRRPRRSSSWPSGAAGSHRGTACCGGGGPASG